MPEPSPYEATRDLLDEMVKQVCLRRANLYTTLRIYDDDKKEVQEVKAALLLQTLHRWAKNPLAFIDEVGWCPDPKDQFGASAVPTDLIQSGLAPRGMVPLILFEKQKEWIKAFFRAIDGRDSKDIGIVKSRQVAMTSLTVLCGLHVWLFRTASPAVWTTYDELLIDPGGSGDRTADSLFGRARLTLDSLTTCIPALRFNAHLKPRFTKYYTKDRWDKELKANPSGLGNSEDKGGKLTRPKWTVHGVEVFRGAETNFILGDIPDDALARGQAVLYVWLDELGQYNQKRAGRDKDAWGASGSATKVRIGDGTIPKGGGQGTVLYEITEQREPDETLEQFFIHWSDLPPYFMGASWKCNLCLAKNDLAPTEPPEKKGRLVKCNKCGEITHIKYKDVTSPWYERACKRANQDRLVIARELDMDWMASQGDRFFYTLDERAAVCSAWPTQRTRMIEGFDPGHSTVNPAGWMLAELNLDTMKPRVVGYWMGANQHIIWWVPFFKRWTSKALQRMTIIYGPKAGQRWLDVFDYDDAALEMLDRVSQYAQGDLMGDKYGSHRNMTESAYDILQRYGLYVDWEYTSDREALCRKGIDWAARLEIDPDIAEVRPPKPTGGFYPSVLQCFATAKPRTSEGQAQVKLDVDKQDPPFVNNGVDAWLYLCKALPEDVHAVVDAEGAWGTESELEARVFNYGWDSSLD